MRVFSVHQIEMHIRVCAFMDPDNGRTRLAWSDNVFHSNKTVNKFHWHPMLVWEDRVTVHRNILLSVPRQKVELWSNQKVPRHAVSAAVATLGEVATGHSARLIPLARGFHLLAQIVHAMLKSRRRYSIAPAFRGVPGLGRVLPVSATHVPVYRYTHYDILVR